MGKAMGMPSKDPWWATAIVAACIASGFIGIGLALWFDNPSWLWLMAPWLIFLS